MHHNECYRIALKDGPLSYTHSIVEDNHFSFLIEMYHYIINILTPFFCFWNVESLWRWELSHFQCNCAVRHCIFGSNFEQLFLCGDNWINSWFSIRWATRQVHHSYNKMQIMNTEKSKYVWYGEREKRFIKSSHLNEIFPDCIIQCVCVCVRPVLLPLERMV